MVGTHMKLPNQFTIPTHLYDYTLVERQPNQVKRFLNLAIERRAAQ